MKHSALKFIFSTLTTLFCGFTSVSFAVQDDFIPLPKYSTVDALGVNVYGNQVQPNLDTLSIGGAMGLSHSIAAQGNTFSYDHGWHGYRDKYAGGVRNTDLGINKLEQGDPQLPDEENYVWVLTATAMGDSAQFVFKCNGMFVDYKENTCTPQQKNTEGYYEALKDKRHTLSNKNGHVVWTKPDGTEVDYGPGPLSRGYETGGNYKITQPNGFTIEVSTAVVTTNTGFQLKYDFLTEGEGLDPAKKGLYPNAEPLESSVPSADWLSKNPKYVHGINTAYEYCNQKAPCTLNYPWPTATFDWPGGMPRALYVGTSIFRVTNATGGVTEYTYEAHDAAVHEGHLLQNYLDKPNTYMVPRLSAIKPVGAKKPTVFYEYDTIIQHSKPADVNSVFIDIKEKPSRLIKAYGLVGSSNYGAGPKQNGGVSYQGYRTQVQTEGGGAPILESISLDDGQRTLIFESGHGQQRNLITADILRHGSSKSYTYTHNNVETVTDQATGLQTAGGYPENCINPKPERNRKTCNLPAWTKDAKGNVTRYTYHEPSGQIATLTSPPNAQGIAAVIRYGYEEKFANYIQTPNGAKTRAPTGIWLKTSEKTCIKTTTQDKTATSDGSCAGGANDEIIKTFEYQHDNLFLTGTTTAAFDKKQNRIITKRICFQYDKYGNKTSESQPKAGLTRCAP